MFNKHKHVFRIGGVIFTSYSKYKDPGKIKLTPKRPLYKRVIVAIYYIELKRSILFAS